MPPNNGFNGLMPALAAFIHGAPPNADRFVVRYTGAAGVGEGIMSRTLKEVREANATDVADFVMGQCRSWADSHGTECVFKMHWLDAAEHILTSHQMRLGSMDSAVPFNGTAESIIAQQQGHNHVLMKMCVDMVQATSKVQREIMEMQQTHIRSLQKKVLGMEDDADKAREILTSIDDPEIAATERRFDRLISGVERIGKHLLAPDAGTPPNGNGNGRTKKRSAEPTPEPSEPEAPPFDPATADPETATA